MSRPRYQHRILQQVLRLFYHELHATGQGYGWNEMNIYWYVFLLEDQCVCRRLSVVDLCMLLVKFGVWGLWICFFTFFSIHLLHSLTCRTSLDLSTCFVLFPVANTNFLPSRSYTAIYSVCMLQSVGCPNTHFLLYDCSLLPHSCAASEEYLPWAHLKSSSVQSASEVGGCHSYRPYDFHEPG
jgi:hypothetical protein